MRLFKVCYSCLVGIVLVNFTSCQPGELEKSSPLTEVYPRLILTTESVEDIKSEITNLPLLKKSFAEIQTIADKAVAGGIIVPVPKDPGGGYTHEQHKHNYHAMYSAGIAFQITGDEKYAEFVKQMLFEYAKLYPTLGLHPEQKNQAPGKLFWQGLNESVWLVYTIQAYDCIIAYLSAEERATIEDNVFRKVVEFFTVEDSYTFNRVHNHGTWSAAGVGMTGMVLNDTNYVEMALYGTDKSGDAGFLKQIDELFSPDGLYAEGPYYQRYAILPFIVFAQALENNRPDIEIFKYKNGVLNKAVVTLLQMTSANGKFYPLNDAIKDKDYLSPELIFATDIAYNNTGNKELLSIAQKHGKVMLSAEGLKVARDVEAGLSEAFNRKSMLISDGKDGSTGGIGILRHELNENKISVMVKATSQGMGHGHFDRLSFLMFENGNEIIRDYGAARFLNIVEKHGGRYLPENNTWAKQTIAHNTVAVNGESNFNGNLKEASKYHPEVLYADINSDDFQIYASVDSHCYKNAVLQRTMALLSVNNSSIVVDLFRILNQTKSVYDLPVYFQGHVISSSFNYKAGLKRIEALGSSNGYQHLWNLAHASELHGISSVTWMHDYRFYTYSFLANEQTELFFTKIAANDPEFNLRNEPGIMIRQKDASNHTFLSVIEAHGSADPVKETVEGTKGSLKDLKIIYQDTDETVSKLEFIDGTIVELFIAHSNNKGKVHEVVIEGENYSWTGNYDYKVYKK